MFNPALTTCASERMKTQRFSYFADFAARERMREAKPVKLKKVAFSHFFDTLSGRLCAAPFFLKNVSIPASYSIESKVKTARLSGKRTQKAAPEGYNRPT